MSVQFVNQVPTRFGVNANGRTYGAITDTQGQPDLVWMSGTDNTGQSIVGYGRSADLDAFSPDHPGQPTSPAEAVRLQSERDQKYSNGWDFPLYESDGRHKSEPSTSASTRPGNKQEGDRPANSREHPGVCRGV